MSFELLPARGQRGRREEKCKRLPGKKPGSLLYFVVRVGV